VDPARRHPNPGESARHGGHPHSPPRPFLLAPQGRGDGGPPCHSGHDRPSTTRSDGSVLSLPFPLPPFTMKTYSDSMVLTRQGAGRMQHKEGQRRMAALLGLLDLLLFLFIILPSSVDSWPRSIGCYRSGAFGWP